MYIICCRERVFLSNLCLPNRLRMSLVFFIITSLCATANAIQQNRPLICYWQSWTESTIGVSSVARDTCTHLIYYRMTLADDRDEVIFNDPHNDEGRIFRFINMKNDRPELKVLFAVGGDSSTFSSMANRPSAREAFARSVDNMMKNGFDGVDLIWLRPGKENNSAIRNDKANFVELLKAVRKQIGKDRLLTIGASGNPNLISAGYSVKPISKVVDYIHVFTFDLWGPWNKPKVVGNHVNIRQRKSDHENQRLSNVESGMSTWSQADPKKLIMGFALYGRTFTLNNSAKTDIGAPFDGSGKSGKTTKESGLLAYFEICELVNNYGWTSIFDIEGEVPYAFKDDQWVGYEDQRGIRAKVKLLKTRGYGGAVVRYVDYDDQYDNCGKGSHPLLKELSSVLNSDEDTNKRESEEDSNQKGVNVLNIMLFVFIALGIIVLIGFLVAFYAQGVFRMSRSNATSPRLSGNGRNISKRGPQTANVLEGAYERFQIPTDDPRADDDFMPPRPCERGSAPAALWTIPNWRDSMF